MISVVRVPPYYWGIRSTSYSESVRRECKSTPGLRYDGRGSWVGYADAIEAARLRLVAAGVRIVGKPGLPPGLSPTPSLTDLSLTNLRAYQTEGVLFLLRHAREGALIADSVGLGKTIQCLRAAQAIGSKTVILCPSFVRGVWEAGLVGDAALGKPAGWPEVASKAFLPKGVKQTAPIPEDTQVVIIHYDIIYAWVEAILAWGPQTAILDECHYLQSDRSRRSKAVKRLLSEIPHRIAASATPMQSRPKDLWNPVDTISPGRFGKAFDYYMKHCEAHREQVAEDRIVWVYDGASNLEELNLRLGHFMIRRTKTDVALQLPPFTRQVITLDVAKSCVVSPAVALADDRALRRALDLAADGKLPSVVEAIVNHVGEGSSVIAFSYRKAIAEAIASAVKLAGIEDVQVVTGDVSHNKRKEIVAAQPKVVCATLDSIGVGIDLSFANVGVFAELDWVATKLVQAEGRLDRFGQKRNVLFQYFIARGSGDEVIRRVLIEKMRNDETAVGKKDDKLLGDLEGAKKSNAALLREVYERILAADAVST